MRISSLAMGAPLAVRVPERVRVSFTAGLALETAIVRFGSEREKADTLTLPNNEIEITTAATIMMVTFLFEDIFPPRAKLVNALEANKASVVKLSFKLQLVNKIVIFLQFNCN